MRFVSNTVSVAFGVFAGALAVALALSQQPPPPEIRRSHPADVHTQPRDVALGTPLRANRSTASVATAPARPKEGMGLRARVERLLVRGTPRDRYLAFGVLARCAHALELDRYLKALPADAGSTRLRQRYGDGPPRVTAACGDLTMRQLDQRIELAASAADDGIPGAASAWIEEGPYGDKTALTQRPGDPLIVEWAQQAIARVGAATRRSDTEAIGQFGMLCLNWELDDVTRVRLLVDAAVESRHEDELERMRE